MSTHRKAGGVAAMVAMLAAGGCASAGGGMAPTAATPQMIAAGQTAYASSCAGCHGPAGAGTQRAPNLADDQYIWLRTSEPLRPQIVAILRNGIPTPRVHTNGMPAVGANMTEEQVQNLAAYVESL